ncbi:unnamed protein product [Ilex paraguariensis]|uniref:WRC domain-containing protein n=1 Tax=Ilex paraguariensis TaxID=185542 RepID=A0ABC8RZQ4_9AQUA
MRIRKRFSSSSLSSYPDLDPQHHRSPVVQHHLQGSSSIELYPQSSLLVLEAKTDSQPINPPNRPLPPSSGQHTMIGIKKPKWVCSGTGDEQKSNQKEYLEGEEVKDERWREDEKNNDIRKGHIIGAEVVAEVLLPSGSSHQVGRWCDRDKVVPFKKRILSFERSMGEEAIMDHGKKKMKVRMKSKTNKNCVLQNGEEQPEGKETKNSTKNNGAIAKKCKRGSVIMEGSRCSRVNGRGWRCCQPTLVGYSLCEHHLGKGRLRSMASVRNQTMDTNDPNVTNKDESEELSSPLLSEKAKQREKRLVLADNDEDGGEDENKKPLMVRKKRMKLGMVKARSISSLLSQTNSAMVIGDNNNKNSSS